MARQSDEGRQVRKHRARLSRQRRHQLTHSAKSELAIAIPC
jgi:hypothetical protein